MRQKANPYLYLTGEGEKRNLSPVLATIVKWIAIGTTLYNMWAVFGYPETLLHLSLNLSLFFALIFLLYTMPGTQTRDIIPWYDWVLALLSVTVCVYTIANLSRLLTRYPFVHKVYPADIIFGVLTVVLLLEGTRRVVGPWLPLLSIITVAYAGWGQYMPGLFGHNGFTLKDIVEALFLTTHGIWGMTMQMAATYIILFIIFGAFLKNSGAGDFLFDFASSLAGWSKGGLAKVGIITSAMFGMISGSPAANISTVGVITIPMMKKSGYPSDFAAAVECCASTGGTIMPPVMGSVAFIMAEVIGQPYIKVVTAAFLPALIYFLALFFAIDFRAGKLGMRGMPRKQIPPLGKTLLKGIVFFIPMAYLVFRLMEGYSPSRVAFETIVLIFMVSWLQKDTRMTLQKTLQALAEGTTQGIMIIAIMAASGILIGIINLTGVGMKFSSFLMAMSSQSTIITLLITVILAMFLGLALNMTTSYLLTAVVAGPVLIKLGISPMAAHLFILFFVAMAPMTPPVALTAFTAAGIAEADPMRVGFLAMRIAMVAYFMPFIFIYQPALLLQASLPAIFLAVISGLCAAAFLAAAVEGWFGQNLSMAQRAVLFAAGLMALPGYLPLLAASVILAVLALVMGRISGEREHPVCVKKQEIKQYTD